MSTTKHKDKVHQQHGGSTISCKLEDPTNFWLGYLSLSSSMTSFSWP